MEKQRLESSRMDIKRNYWPLRRTWTSKRYWHSLALPFSPPPFRPFALSFHLAFFLARYPSCHFSVPILSFIQGLSSISSFFSQDCPGYFPIPLLHTRNLNYRCPSQSAATHSSASVSGSTRIAWYIICIHQRERGYHQEFDFFATIRSIHGIRV